MGRPKETRPGRSGFSALLTMKKSTPDKKELARIRKARLAALSDMTRAELIQIIVDETEEAERLGRSIINLCVLPHKGRQLFRSVPEWMVARLFTENQRLQKKK